MLARKVSALLLGLNKRALASKVSRKLIAEYGSAPPVPSSLQALPEGVFHRKAHEVTNTTANLVDPAFGKKTSVIFQIQDGHGALNQVP